MSKARSDQSAIVGRFIRIFWTKRNFNSEEFAAKSTRTSFYFRMERFKLSKLLIRLAELGSEH